MSGLASGFDWRSLVDQLVDLERAPQRRLRTEQSSLQSLNAAYGTLLTQLGSLQIKAKNLTQTSFFNTRTAQSSDSKAASASATGDTPSGEYQFSISQFATAAVHQGTSNAGRALSATSDVSGLVLSAASFRAPVSAGTFTVNGKQITVATTDTLQQVFDAISSATGGAVTGSYDAAADKITLSSASAITLGSVTDTSNFLAAAKLNNNGSGTVTSATALGVAQLNSTLGASNLAVAVSDGGAGAGSFKINGVAISFNATTDTLQGLIQRINNSNAGVVASYDAENDRFTLTNKTTGDVGIALEDVTGNFLAASGLAGGTLSRGKDLLYSVNGGPTLTSRSNRITADSSGIPGLSVDVLIPTTTGSSGGASSTSNTTSTTTNTTTNAAGYPDARIVSAFGGGGANATRVTFPANHNFTNGQMVRLLTTGTLPSMVDANTTYYARSQSGTSISLHTSLADAVNNANAINFGASPAYTGNAFVTPHDPFAAPGSSTSTTTTSTTTTTTTSGGSSEGPVASFKITVATDTSGIKKAITDFIAEYNKTQDLIDAQTASTTDAKGKVTQGVLADQGDADQIASRLRSILTGQVSGLSGTLKQLDQIGISSNGNDHRLTLSDAAKLDDALAKNLNEVSDLFTHNSSGVFARLNSYLDNTAGESGALSSRRDTLLKQSASIDTQIADLERFVLSTRQQLIDSFVSMERAQASLNQQLQFLLQRFGS